MRAQFAERQHERKRRVVLVGGARGRQIVAALSVLPLGNQVADGGRSAGNLGVAFSFVFAGKEGQRFTR